MSGGQDFTLPSKSKISHAHLVKLLRISLQKLLSIPGPGQLNPGSVHVDHVGLFLGKIIFIAMDAHSKWPEACIMTSTTAVKTITALREMFARYGIP